MNRTTLARRYAPLLAVVAIQLLIIAAVPSRAPQSDSLATGGAAPEAYVPGDGTGAVGDLGGDTGTGADTGAPTGTDGGSTGAVGSGGTGGTGGAGGSTAGRGGSTTGGTVAPGRGDTSHCVDGRQYDPKLYYYAPNCVPKFTGKNAGATYQGVTDTSIKIIKYNGRPNEAVDAILRSQGSAAEPGDITAFMKAAEKFINARYELYGRKIVMEEFNGQCATVPPDYQCLRNEMREMVKARKPFGVIWNTSLASPAFDELSAQKVVNLGGWHFRDVFNQQRRPYHWDWPMGGTQLVRHAGEWYCKRMHGGGQAKARYAGETGTGAGQNAPNNDIRNKPRVLGVISTDDPENKLAIEELKRELAKCGAKVSHEYYYAQDIARAEEQRRLAVARMREAPESTTIMCFCDLVAPLFLYQTCEEQRYYPEHIMVGAGFMDADAAAQAYDHTLPPEGHQFENAFGLASTAEQEFRDSNDANRIWKAAGNAGVIPSRYGSATADWQYYAMLATMIQAAGPNLTPATMEAGAFALGVRGGSAQTLDPLINQRSFRQGDYTWNDDMREVYWSTTRQSRYNRETGTYVTLNNNRRFNIGQYPGGEITIPQKPR